MDSSAWSASWSAEQLAEFVASVSSADTEAAAAWAAVERAAEALDADVAAIVRDGDVVAQIGYQEASAPAAELAAVTPGMPGSRLDVPGVGGCVATAAMLDHPSGARLVIARAGADGLSPQEAGLLRGMARVAAMTMRMHRALDDERSTRGELERLAREQAALRRVATLVAKGASPDETFSAVAEELAQLSGAEIALVLRYEADETATVVGGWAETERQITTGMRVTVQGEGVAVSIRQTGRPARTERLAGPPGSVPDLLRSVGARTGSGSPIVVEDRLWGAVIAATIRPEGLRPESEHRIPAFAELLATAIANAQARVEVRTLVAEQMALRHVATLVARGAPPAEVFAAVASEVGQVLDAADFAMVARYDSGRAVEVVGGWSRAGDQDLVGRRGDLRGRTVSSLVFEGREPARVDHLAEDKSSATSVAARELGMRSSAGAPINVGGRLWGVVIVTSTHDDALPADTEYRLADFTELVATAIANAQARQDVNALAQEQAALRRVATLVARGEPPRRLFAAVAAEVGRLLPVDLTVIGRYDPDGLVTTMGAWNRTGDVTHLVPRASLEGGEVIRAIFDTRRPARMDDYALNFVPADAGIHSTVGAPISVEGRLWGAMLVASTREEPLPAGIENRLADFTELVATAIANAQAQDELTASRARIVATADETRRRIERDLHDGAQQRLVSVALQLRATLAGVPPVMGQFRAELDQAVRYLNDALEELREIARGIHPAALVEGGLEPALRTLARRSSVPVRLRVRSPERLPEGVEVTAYYVVSEALTNVSKHAKASAVDVAVEAVDGVLRVAVDDDGVGGADPRRGSGLVGLKDRVEATGGTLSMQSRTGEGTHLLIELPADLY